MTTHRKQRPGQLAGILLFLICATIQIANAQSGDITDPLGNVQTVGTEKWYFWSGFGVGCVFFTFGLIKRLAQRATGHADF